MLLQHENIHDFLARGIRLLICVHRIVGVVEGIDSWFTLTPSRPEGRSFSVNIFLSLCKARLSASQVCINEAVVQTLIYKQSSSYLWSELRIAFQMQHCPWNFKRINLSCNKVHQTSYTSGWKADERQASINVRGEVLRRQNMIHGRKRSVHWRI